MVGRMPPISGFIISAHSGQRHCAAAMKLRGQRARALSNARAACGRVPAARAAARSESFLVPADAAIARTLTPAKLQSQALS